MKSALKLVAFAKGNPMLGVIALLETALEALDDAGQAQAALYVDHALNLCMNEIDEKAASQFAGIATLQ